MTPSKYINTFQKLGRLIPLWNSVFLIIKELSEQDKDLIIQKAVKNCGLDIVCDGIVGPNTIRLIGMCKPMHYLSEIGKLLVEDKKEPAKFDKSKNTSGKDFIMGYLAKAEGSHLHYNRTEKDFTTGYGIYAHSFPKAKIVRYIRRRAREMGYKRITRSNVNIIDSKFTNEDRKVMYDMAYEFYVNNFMNARVNEIVENKSQLSFFSIAVNGGRGRAAKVLQKAINVKADGKIGRGTLSKLERYCESNNDDTLNQGMLRHMHSFYLYLVRKNAKKFGLYLKGWTNRLKGLGYRCRKIKSLC